MAEVGKEYIYRVRLVVTHTWNQTRPKGTEYITMEFNMLLRIIHVESQMSLAIGLND